MPANSRWDLIRRLRVNDVLEFGALLIGKKCEDLGFFNIIAFSTHRNAVFMSRNWVRKDKGLVISSLLFSIPVLRIRETCVILPPQWITKLSRQNKCIELWIWLVRS